LYLKIPFVNPFALARWPAAAQDRVLESSRPTPLLAGDQPHPRYPPLGLCVGFLRVRSLCATQAQTQARRPASPFTPPNMAAAPTQPAAPPHLPFACPDFTAGPPYWLLPPPPPNTPPPPPPSAAAQHLFFGCVGRRELGFPGEKWSLPPRCSRPCACAAGTCRAPRLAFPQLAARGTARRRSSQG
jgi:hypothetical protein